MRHGSYIKFTLKSMAIALHDIPTKVWCTGIKQIQAYLIR